MEEYTPQSQEEKNQQIKRWFQDNLRIIISIAIVVAIAGGIYSYSNRGSVVKNTDSSSEQVAQDQTSDQDSTDTSVKSNPTDNAKVSTTTASQETGSSFIETAAKGNGLTVLARQATANYLEKNPDSTLTKEHKLSLIHI